MFGLDPLEAVVEEALEGPAPDEGQGLGAELMASAPPLASAWRLRRTISAQSSSTSLQQVALLGRGLGEVLGSDPLAQLGEVVAQRLLGDLGTARTRPGESRSGSVRRGGAGGRDRPGTPRARR